MTSVELEHLPALQIGNSNKLKQDDFDMLSGSNTLVVHLTYCMVDIPFVIFLPVGPMYLHEYFFLEKKDNPWYLH